MIINLFKKIWRSPSKGKNKNQASWFSVGLKMMIGVGLISISCMGILVYINYQAFAQMGKETNALLDVNDEMNQELRSSIFELQQKYLDIPKLLQVNPTEEIMAWIKSSYTVSNESTIEGSDNYRPLFNRSQRRDISKGKYVVKSTDGNLIIYKGLTDPNGEFKDAVHQFKIESTDPDTDKSIIEDRINTIIQNASSADALELKVLALKDTLTDEAIAAEKARNAILYKLEDMEKEKALLVQNRQAKQQTIGILAVAAILINLVLLHFMAWFIIEKPLKKLSKTIEQINQGEEATIPYQTRRDRIGVLAGTLLKFQGVLTHIRKEDQRKKQERQIIQDLIQSTSAMIETIQSKASTMKKSAIELSTLAVNTETQTNTATASAAKTVKQTDAVSSSARQLKSSVDTISDQIIKQNSLVEDINSVTQASMADIQHLTEASKKISEITHIVKNIAKESNLLALNARIEASKSGEAGKGFTVVANEVRGLSIQTSSANEDIAQKVASIQTASETIINHTKQIEQRIERLTQASLQISQTVEKQSSVTDGIAEHTHATSDNIKDVSDRILKVKEAAQTTSRFAGDVQSYSEQIEANLSGLLAETRQRLSSIGISEPSDPHTDQSQHPAGTRKNAA